MAEMGRKADTLDHALQYAIVRLLTRQSPDFNASELPPKPLFPYMLLL